MTILDLIDYLQQFPMNTRVVYHQEDMEDRDIDFIGLDTLDYDGDNPIYGPTGAKQVTCPTCDTPKDLGQPCPACQEDEEL